MPKCSSAIAAILFTTRTTGRIRFDMIRPKPLNGSRRFSNKPLPEISSKNSESKNGDSGWRCSALRIESALRFSLLSGHVTDHVLKCSERTDGRAVDTTKKNGHDRIAMKSGRTEGHVSTNCINEGTTAGAAAPGKRWRDYVAEIEKQAVTSKEKE